MYADEVIVVDKDTAMATVHMSYQEAVTNKNIQWLTFIDTWNLDNDILKVKYSILMSAGPSRRRKKDSAVSYALPKVWH